MELEKQILNDYFSKGDKTYELAEIQTKIIELETQLMKDIPASEKEMLIRLIEQYLKQKRIEELNLITYILYESDIKKP